MKVFYRQTGFTVVELLVALAITGIILSAVATLAFAMSSASDASNDNSQQQGLVRYATVRIGELLRYSKLICHVTEEDIVIWRADNDSANGKIDVQELVYIEKGPDGDYLRFTEFENCPPALQTFFNSRTNPIQILQDNHLSWKNLFASGCDEQQTLLLSDIENVIYTLDQQPPHTRNVLIQFDLIENNTNRTYQISVSLRGWAQNCLDGDGELVGDDD